MVVDNVWTKIKRSSERVRNFRVVFIALSNCEILSDLRSFRFKESNILFETLAKDMNTGAQSTAKSSLTSSSSLCGETNRELTAQLTIVRGSQMRNVFQIRFSPTKVRFVC